MADSSTPLPSLLYKGHRDFFPKALHVPHSTSKRGYHGCPSFTVTASSLVLLNCFALLVYCFVVLERFETSEMVGTFLASTPLLKEAWRLCIAADRMGCGGFVAEQVGGRGVRGILRRPRAAGAWLGSELWHAGASGCVRPRAVCAFEMPLQRGRAGHGPLWSASPVPSSSSFAP
ncbi:hypothetical protein NL676_019495 [Syzygium grande]|nr:hypothetical protein NL676_019495 [Syzygium grande]